MKSEFSSQVNHITEHTGSTRRRTGRRFSDLFGRLFLALLPAIVLGLFFFDSAAPVSGTISSELTIATRLTLVRTIPLEFGQVRPGRICDGTVIVTTANVRTASGCANIAALGSNLHSRGELAVTGVAGASYTMSVVADLSLHDNRNDPILGITALTVTDLVTFSVTRNMGDGPNGLIDPFGNDQIFVGGTLQVPAGAKNGKYEGEVVLTINF